MYKVICQMVFAEEVAPKEFLKRSFDVVMFLLVVVIAIFGMPWLMEQPWFWKMMSG